MAWEFWEDELRTFPRPDPEGGCALWVARREGEGERETLRLLYAPTWAARSWAPPLGRLWRAVETGCAAEGAWQPRGKAAPRQTHVAGQLARPTLWVEPLRRDQTVLGAMALAYDATPPWGETVRLWGRHLAARVGPLLDRLPPCPGLSPGVSHERQLLLFPLPPPQSAPHASRSPSGRAGLALPRPVCVPGVPGAVGVGEAFRACCAQAMAVAAAGVSVILQGESGTGKEILARAIHLGSPRHARPFIGVNCAAFPETLFESELFGHRAGAFTGAASEKIGLLEAANGGTFFLDEIGDMPVALQIKLLRVMQEKRVRRIGDLESRPVDLRWIAATNKDLISEINAGRFRLDLYYRLKVVRIAIPPLRSRPEDVPHLLAFFLRRHGGDPERHRLEPDVLAALQAWRWPGNARELENEALRLLALHGGEELIRLAHLSPELQAAAGRTVDPEDLATLRTLDAAGALLERYLIGKAIEVCGGRKAAAARRLGLSRQGLYKKIRRHGLVDLLAGTRDDADETPRAEDGPR